MTITHEDQVQSDADRLLPIIEAALLAHLEKGDAPVLLDSMRYSLKAGGKRVRPLLCLLAAESIGAPCEAALPCAVALEYIHTYSLIHDDLPAMDDDDLRRGKPTNHKVFGEGQAVLAGDGLLTGAFAILAGEGGMTDAQRVEAIRVLADAAGWDGMVGGQSLDLEGVSMVVRTGRPYDTAYLQKIHLLKTGALLRASLELGAIAAGADREFRQSLRDAGTAIGLAFQIKDDILDTTSTAEAMGKKVGKDAGKGKITYPKLMGLDGAEAALAEATGQAARSLRRLPNPGSLLAWTQHLSSRTK